jgi:hypothetical protein
MGCQIFDENWTLISSFTGTTEIPRRTIEPGARLIIPAQLHIPTHGSTLHLVPALFRKKPLSSDLLLGDSVQINAFRECCPKLGNAVSAS